MSTTTRIMRFLFPPTREDDDTPSRPPPQDYSPIDNPTSTSTAGHHEDSNNDGALVPSQEQEEEIDHDNNDNAAEEETVPTPTPPVTTTTTTTSSSPEAVEARSLDVTRGSYVGTSFKEIDIGSRIETISLFNNMDNTSSLILVGTRRKALLIDADTNVAQHEISFDSGWVNASSFSPDGKSVIIGGEGGKVIIYDIVLGQNIHTLQRGNSTVWTVQFSPSSDEFIVGGTEGKAALYSSSTFEEMHAFDGVGPTVFASAFSPDGSLLCIGGNNNKAILYKVSTHEMLQTFERDSFINAIDFSQDGTRVATGGQDATVGVYDVVLGTRLCNIKRDGAITSISFSSTNDILVIGGFDKQVVVYDATTFQPINTLPRDDKVRAASYLSDGQRLVCGGFDCKVTIFENLSRGNNILNHSAGLDVWKSKFSNDGNHLVVVKNDERDKAIMLDAMSGKEEKVFSMGFPINNLLFSHNGEWIALGGGIYGSYGKASIVKITGETLHTFESDHIVHTVSFSPKDDMLVVGDGSFSPKDVGGDDYQATIYNTSTFKLLHSFSMDLAVFAASFSNDGKKLIVGVDNKATIFDIASRDIIQTIDFTTYIASAIFSNNDEEIWIGDGSGKVYLCNKDTQNPIHSLEHNGRIRSLEIEQYNGIRILIAAGREDHIVTLYNSDTFEPIYTFLSPSTIRNVSFTNNHEHTNPNIPLLAISTTSNGIYVIPINHTQQTLASSMPVDDLIQPSTSIDIDTILQFNTLTSGAAMMQRNNDGLIYLHLLAKHERHELLSKLIQQFPQKLFQSTTSHLNSELIDIMTCLYTFHHVETINMILTSTSITASTAPTNLQFLTRHTLQHFSINTPNLDVIKNILRLGETGYTEGHIQQPFTKTHLIDEKNNPLVKPNKCASSPFPNDGNIWDKQSSLEKDTEKRICLATQRVALPGLGSSKSLQCLTSFESNDAFAIKSVQMTVESHWYGWARKWFAIQAVIYLLWLIGLTMLNKVYMARRLLDEDRFYSTTADNVDGDGGGDEWYESTTVQYCLVTVTCLGITYFSFVEALQSSNDIEYYQNVWNVYQCLTLAIAAIFIVTNEVGGGLPNVVTAVISGLNMFFAWFGLLYYLRLFDNTAWIVFALFRILVKIWPFFVVLLLILNNFGMSLWAMYKGPTDADGYYDRTRVFSSLPRTWNVMAFAGISADYNDKILEETYSYRFSYSLMMTLIVTVSIVSINSTISFISDIFDRILEEKAAVLTRIKAGCILQSYYMISRAERERVEKEYEWTYRLVSPSGGKRDDDDDDDGKGDDVRKEEDPMYRRANKTDLKHLEKRLERKLDEKVNKLDVKVNNLDEKVNNLDEKVNKLDEKVNKLDEKVNKIEDKMKEMNADMKEILRILKNK